MRNSTDKLLLNVPEIAYPQEPLTMETDDGEIEIPPGSFGAKDENNHNV